MTGQRISLRAFIGKHRIRFACKMTDRNPHMDDRTHPMDHWLCRLRCGDRRMTVYFSMGVGLSREPTAADVLDCLASDSAGIENARSFEEWCDESGYDHDSRKAHRTYRVCERQAKKLEALLGHAAYEDLLWNTERE